MIQYFVNTDLGMIFMVQGRRWIGRKYQEYEQLELNSVRVDGSYYKQGASIRNLVELIPYKEDELSSFDLHEQCEELNSRAF